MINRENFTKLANRLETVPERQFDMRSYVSDYDGVYPQHATHIPCGTSACALGWGPAAGIPWTKIGNIGWYDYFKTQFSDEPQVYDWCFNDEWGGTPRDAVNRIRYMLAHGVPKSFTEPSRHFQKKANAGV